MPTATKTAPRTKKKKAAPAARRTATAGTLVMVGTRKGAWLYRSDASRKTWQPSGPHFLGHIVQHVVLDPRDRRTLIAATKTGHLGPALFRSFDLGRTWKETKAHPAFPKVPEGEKGRAVDHVFWLTSGHASEPSVWYAGTSPQAISSDPDRLYQQNHCGIYRIDRPSSTWTRVGKAMPKKVGDVGFPMVVHPRDANRAWVFPMDGTSVWPRTSPDGKPAAYGTRNGGKTWQRLDEGLPREQAFWTVKRQAMSCDSHDPIGLYLGTTSGELWMSRDEGARWKPIAQHLPEIYSVETAQL